VRGMTKARGCSGEKGGQGEDVDDLLSRSQGRVGEGLEDRAEGARASSQSRRGLAESVWAPASAARRMCGELEEARDAETDRTIDGCAFPSCVRCFLDACHAGGDCAAADEVRTSPRASPWMRV